MTVASQVKQTVSSLKGIMATLVIYNTQDADNKNQAVLEATNKELTNIIYDLERRIKQLEFEEPQYKGY